MGKTLYDILEVSPSASPEAIAVAHKRLTEKYHPEHPRNQDNPDAFNLYKAVNDAFKTLSHPELRQRYDQRLDTEARAEAAPPPTSRLGTWLAGLLLIVAATGAWQYHNKLESEKARALAEAERQTRERREMELAAEAEKTRIAQEAAEAQRQARAQSDARLSFDIANARATYALRAQERAASQDARNQELQRQAQAREQQREAQLRLERDKALLRQMEYDNRRGPSYHGY